MNIIRHGKLSETDIAAWLVALRTHPYVPESHFHVTAAVRSGDYYFGGVNVENADHRLSTHAEEACIAALVATLGKSAGIDEIWVMGATCCGKCRQQLSGFAAADVKVHYLSLDGKPPSATTVGAFLPGTFTLSRFADARKAATVKPAADIVKKGTLAPAEIFNWIKTIDSVDFFSKMPQAMVLKLDNGAFVAGSKVEDEAFLSMTAAQAAQAIAVSEFGPAIKVTEAWVLSSGAFPLSALQVLLQLAAHPDIALNFFAPDASVTRMTLPEAAAAYARKN